jgi:hypothetical protein
LLERSDRRSIDGRKRDEEAVIGEQPAIFTDGLLSWVSSGFRPRNADDGTVMTQEQPDLLIEESERQIGA